MMVPSFEVSIYDVVVYVCSTREEVKACVDRLGGALGEHEARGDGITLEVGRGGVAWHVLAVFDGGVGTLVHEASHVTDMILKRKGIGGEVDTEVRAYLIGYIADQAALLLRGMKWPKRQR